MFKKLLAKLKGRARGAGEFHLGDPGMATHSMIRVDSEGRRQECRVGTTAYGKTHQPPGGHVPDTIIETDD